MLPRPGLIISWRRAIDRCGLGPERPPDVDVTCAVFDDGSAGNRGPLTPRSPPFPRRRGLRGVTFTADQVALGV